MAAIDTGAGRRKKEDAIAYGSGFVFHANVGDPVEKGQTLVTIHSDRPEQTAGGAGAPGPGDPHRPAARRQAEDDPAPGGQGRRPPLALLTAVAKRYKAIFFDADDTLFDYPRAERAALLACLGEFRIRDRSRSLHRRLPPPQPRRLAGVRARRNRPGHACASSASAGWPPSWGCPACPWKGSAPSTWKRWPASRSCCPGRWTLVRGLAGEFPLALVTNGIAAVQNRRFAASPITPYFRSIVISEEVGIAKPDPRIFQPALEKLGVEAADVLYVGDSVTSDMAAARNAGMDFCWLNPKGLPCPAEHAPRFIVREISEIPGLLTRPDPDKETDMHPIEKRSLEHQPFHWLTFLLEMVMIVFSILLALNLESWREGRKEREQARSALQNISSEIRQNRKTLSTVIPMHHKFTADLQKTIGKLSELKKSGTDKDKGLGLNFELRPPHLYQAAWQTVLSTQSLKKTDYQTILAIAELYEMQRWMSLIEEKVLQAMLAPGAFDEKNVTNF